MVVKAEVEEDPWAMETMEVAVAKEDSPVGEVELEDSDDLQVKGGLVSSWDLHMVDP